jgi:membrane protein implicated in regulation of membrane protease activity
LYYPILVCYDQLALVPKGGFAWVPVVFIEVPIVGATIYSVVLAMIAACYVEGVKPKIRDELKEVPSEGGQEEPGQ